MSREHEVEDNGQKRVSRRGMLTVGGGVAIASTLVGSLSRHSVAEAQTQASGKPLLDDILDRKELRVGTFLQYPPIMFKDKNGEPQGFEVDMARDMGTALGVKVTFVDSAWEGLLPGIQSGKFDVIIAQMAITAERAKVIHFAKPFEATGLVAVVSPKAPLTDASDVKSVVGYLNKADKKVVVQLGQCQREGEKTLLSHRANGHHPESAGRLLAGQHGPRRRLHHGRRERPQLLEGAPGLLQGRAQWAKAALPDQLPGGRRRTAWTDRVLPLGRYLRAELDRLR